MKAKNENKIKRTGKLSQVKYRKRLQASLRTLRPTSAGSAVKKLNYEGHYGIHAKKFAAHE